MKIAFISYEYPPDTAYGGIGTYMYQAAQMMYQRGHHVEVFTSSPHRSATNIEDDILVHRINEKSRELFPAQIGKVFAKRHDIIEFDVLEGPEYKADTQEAVALVPAIPLLIKLHSPSFFIYQLNGSETHFPLKLRREIGALVKGYRDRYWLYNPKIDIECTHALEADEIVTPSHDLGRRTLRTWSLDPEKISCIPYPYKPSSSLLRIPVETRNEVVTFIGKLEIRKGVVDLAQAIPSILKHCPHTKFQFIGPSDFSHKAGFSSMRNYLEYKLRPYRDAVKFIDRVPLECIPEILAATDICIFPSIWENFPNVCLEAMSAGRCVVGSNAGGMVDMLKNGEFGRLIPPRSPQIIAQTVITLLKNPELRIKLGEAARNNVLTEYNIERIGTLQEASYQRAIARRRAIGARNISGFI